MNLLTYFSFESGGQLVENLIDYKKNEHSKKKITPLLSTLIVEKSKIVKLIFIQLNG